MVTRGRWASLTRLLVCRRAGLVRFKTAPWFGRMRPSARSGSAAPAGRRRNEQNSPVCSTKDQGQLSSEHKLPNRGVRERLCARAGCHAAPGTQEILLLRVQVSVDARDAGIDLTACADSEIALGSRDCGAVELLSTQIVRKQAKAIISNGEAYCMQRRRQRFPTLRTSR